MNNEHAPDAPDMIEQIKDIVTKTTEEAIAPLRELIAKKNEEQPPKSEGVGGAPQPDSDFLRAQRTAYEQSGLAKDMDFDEFIKGIEV